MIKLGEIVGSLTPQAAADLGLPEGLPVAQGGADAFIGMLGLGVINPGQMVGIELQPERTGSIALTLSLSHQVALPARFSFARHC